MKEAKLEKETGTPYLCREKLEAPQREATVYSSLGMQSVLGWGHTNLNCLSFRLSMCLAESPILEGKK